MHMFEDVVIEDAAAAADRTASTGERETDKEI
jgi:hypothetical protein